MPRARSILGPFVVLGLLGLSIAMYVRLNVDSVATGYVTGKLNACFAGSEFSAQVNEAVYIDGKGFELRGLELFITNGPRRQLLDADSAFITIPTEFANIVSLDIQPTAIEICHASLKISEADIAGGTLHRLIRLLQHQRSEQKLIPVRIRDSEIQYSGNGNDESSQLSRVDFNIEPGRETESSLLHFECQAEGSHIRSLAGEGLVDLKTGQWQFQLHRIAATCNNELLRLLPIALEFENFNLQGLQGQLEMSGIIGGDPGSSPTPRFRITGKASNFSLHNDSVPMPLLGCSAAFSMDNRGFEINRAQGQIGDGRFELAYRQQGIGRPDAWDCSGSLEAMRFEHRLLKYFPGFCEKFCNDFSPSGTFDMQFKIDSQGRKDITGLLRDMSFSYHRFPFQVNHCVGNVRWIDDSLSFKVQSLEQQQLLEFDGHIQNPGQAATFAFNFGTEGRLPIDAKLLNSLQNHPAMNKAFRDFRPMGTVSGQGSVKKLTPDAEIVQKDVRIKLHNCSVRHACFDYPMQNVNGAIHVTQDGFTFKEITGSNSSGQTLCNGIWNTREGLSLTFICNSVHLDDRLRDALTPTLQSVWDAIRPDGRIKLGRVFLDYLPRTGGPDIRVEANLGDSDSASDIHAVSINPVSFPYRIEQLQGNIEIGRGAIRLGGLLGKHGKTWLACAGQGQYSGSNWSVSLQNLLAGSVVPDEDLLRALPSELAEAVRQFEFQGQMNVSGAMKFGGSYNDSSSIAEGNDDSEIQQVVFETEDRQASSFDWNLRLDIDQASMQAGLPLENIFGSVNLTGNYNGHQAQCAGVVSLDSVTLYGTQITEIQGPIWIDNEQTLFGKFAKSAESAPQSLAGKIFDGQVVLDGWVAHEDSSPFFVQSTIEKSKLEEVAAEIAPHLEELSGDGYGFLRLRGNADDLYSFAGNGNIHLRNAKIHQLPVMLSLLKILSIKEVTRTAFDSSDVDFTIKGDQIKLDRIELIGDAISLIGNGYMEWMRYADINFYSVVGRNRLYIPIVSELYRASSQRIMWINIGGPMDNLQTTRRVLPGLNDSIRTLFQSQNGIAGQ